MGREGEERGWGERVEREWGERVERGREEEGREEGKRKGGRKERRKGERERERETTDYIIKFLIFSGASIYSPCLQPVRVSLRRVMKEHWRTGPRKR